MPIKRRKRIVSINGIKIAPGPISQRQKESGLNSLATGLWKRKTQEAKRKKRRRGVTPI